MLKVIIKQEFGDALAWWTRWKRHAPAPNLTAIIALRCWYDVRFRSVAVAPRYQLVGAAMSTLGHKLPWLLRANGGHSDTGAVKRGPYLLGLGASIAEKVPAP
jgi:hypothetical protein